MAKDFLKELDDASSKLDRAHSHKRKSGHRENIRRAEKELIADEGEGYSEIYGKMDGFSIGARSSIDEDTARGYAKALLRHSAKTGNMYEAFLAAQFYEEIGRPEKAFHGLVQAYKRSDPKHKEEQYQRIKDFIERNSASEGDTGLEGKVGVFAVSTIAGIALGASSLSLTGNAISNITGSPQGLLGVFLLIFGIVGLAFSLNKNKA